MQNITAGIAGLLSLFPADKRPSMALQDVVASSVPLNTPFGMTIALASVWSGTSPCVQRFRSDSLGAGLRMIGRPAPTWPNEQDEENHAEQLETLAEGEKPTLLFM